MKKRLLSIVFVLSLLVVLFAATTTVSAKYSDIEGHWGEAAINRWSDKGVVQGMGDGSFDPDGKMTRAQAASVFANLLRLNKKGDISNFKDVPADAWYADVIALCVGHGIMEGTSQSTMDPNGLITREQMFTMFGRALGIVPQENLEKNYHDSHEISNWASGYVNALSNKGYISGTSETTMEPATHINRASVMTLLNNSIHSYANTHGETIQPASDGITLVVSDEVTIIGSSSDLVVSAPEVVTTEGGEAEAVQPVVKVVATTVAENLTVITNTRVELINNTSVNNVVIKDTASGAVVVNMDQSTVGNMEVNADVKVENTTVTGTVTINSGSNVDLSGDSKVENVVVTDKAEGSSITSSGNATVGNVEVNASVKVDNTTVTGTVTVNTGSNVDLSGGTKVENVVVTDKAEGSNITTGQDTTVGKVEVNGSNATVSGNGNVSNVVVNGNNTTVETGNTKVEVSENASGTTVGGNTVEGGSSVVTPPTTTEQPVTPSVPIVPSTPVTYYNFTLTLSNADGSKSVTRINRNVVGVKSGADSVSVLAEAIQMVNDAKSEFEEKFDGLEAYTALQDMISAYNTAAGNGSADAWNNFIDNTVETDSSFATSLKEVFKSNIAATYATVGVGTATISYTVGGTTYNVTFTIAKR